MVESSQDPMACDTRSGKDDRELTCVKRLSHRGGDLLIYFGS
jgi:hypothetical protein